MKKILLMCVVIGISIPLMGVEKVESRTEINSSDYKAINFLDDVNEENGTDYKLLDKDYITIILTLDLEEEGSEGISSQGIDEILRNSNHENMVGVKFNELNSNTYYYIRFRKVKEVGSDVNTGYEVEIAKDSSYNESRKVIIGKEINEEGIQFKWSRSLKIKTRGEINDSIDDSLFIIDDRDYIAEETIDGTIEYVFNENERFVSRLLNNLTNQYEIDISKDHSNIRKRVIKIPKESIEGLVQSRMDLKIRSVGITTTLENVFLSNVVKDMVDGSNLIITLEQNNRIYGMIDFEDKVLSTPEKIIISIDGAYGKVVDNIGSGFKIAPNVNTDVLPDNLNINFYSTEDINEKFNIEPLADEINGKTRKTYFLLGTNLPKTLAVKNEINDLTKKLKITDMEYYYEDLRINTTQFNNIIIAILKNDREVSMNEKLSKNKYNFLGKSQMLVSGKYVTKEEGISSIVKLYELKNKSRIHIESEIKLSNKNKITPKYRNSIKKAISAGLIDDGVDFKSNMTFKEFVYLINRI